MNRARVYGFSIYLCNLSHNRSHEKLGYRIVIKDQQPLLLRIYCNLQCIPLVWSKPVWSQTARAQSIINPVYTWCNMLLIGLHHSPVGMVGYTIHTLPPLPLQGVIIITLHTFSWFIAFSHSFLLWSNDNTSIPSHNSFQFAIHLSCGKTVVSL